MIGRYSRETMSATIEQVSAGSTVGSVTEPSSSSAVNSAPPRGTLYTAANPAPPPQATSSRCCARDSRNQSDSRLPTTPPSSLGACSRPSEAPRPMTISEMIPVPSERRSDSRPPCHTTSSSSDFSPGVNLRSRYQATPPNTPAMNRSTTRRSADERSTAASKLPLWKKLPMLYPYARCWTLNKITIMASPSRPAPTPVATTSSQKNGVRVASPSPVAFGCSVAPRPDGSRVRISGCGIRTRWLGCPAVISFLLPCLFRTVAASRATGGLVSLVPPFTFARFRERGLNSSITEVIKPGHRPWDASVLGRWRHRRRGVPPAPLCTAAARWRAT